MALPEGNGSFVGSCGLEKDGANAARGEVRLGLAEKLGTDAASAVRRGHVERDDVRQRSVFFGEKEAGDALVLFGNQALRSIQFQKIAQACFRVGNPGRKTCLVEPVQGREVACLVRAEDGRHAGIVGQNHGAKVRGWSSSVPGKVAKRKARSGGNGLWRAQWTAFGIVRPSAFTVSSSGTGLPFSFVTTAKPPL